MPTRWVTWIEPFGPNDEPVYCRVTESTAIAKQRQVALVEKHYYYQHDQQALDDFIAIHWANLVTAGEDSTNG